MFYRNAGMGALLLLNSILSFVAFQSASAMCLDLFKIGKQIARPHYEAQLEAFDRLEIVENFKLPGSADGVRMRDPDSGERFSFVLRALPKDQVSQYQFSSAMTRFFGGGALPTRIVDRDFGLKHHGITRSNWIYFIEPYLSSSGTLGDYLESNGRLVPKRIAEGVQYTSLMNQSISGSWFRRPRLDHEFAWIPEEKRLLRNLILQFRGHQVSLDQLEGVLDGAPLHLDEFERYFKDRVRQRFTIEQLERLSRLWVGSLLSRNIDLHRNNVIWNNGDPVAIDFGTFEKTLKFRPASNPILEWDESTTRLFANQVLHSSFPDDLRRRLSELSPDEIGALATLAGLSLSEAQVESMIVIARRLADSRKLGLNELNWQD